jgi:hypothetical protein
VGRRERPSSQLLLITLLLLFMHLQRLCCHDLPCTARRVCAPCTTASARTTDACGNRNPHVYSNIRFPQRPQVHCDEVHSGTSGKFVA